MFVCVGFVEITSKCKVKRQGSIEFLFSSCLTSFTKSIHETITFTHLFSDDHRFLPSSSHRVPQVPHAASSHPPSFPFLFFAHCSRREHVLLAPLPTSSTSMASTTNHISPPYTPSTT